MSPLMPSAEPALDPKKLECMGLYLYGSGYYAREDQQMAIVRGERTEASFCNDECPMREQCERQHRARTQEILPAEVETFERECEKAWKKMRVSPLVVAAMRMKRGDPEPYMKVALENYKRGAADRRREQGSPIIRRG